MKLSKSTIGLIALLLAIVLIGTTYVGYTQIFATRENALTIISMDINKTEQGNNFTAEITIKNTGKNDITNASLNIIFIKNNDIINSETQSVTLQTNSQSTYSAQFQDLNFNTGSSYKMIASIYLRNESLDSQTITKQF